jgi:hypothetical protein
VRKKNNILGQLKLFYVLTLGLGTFLIAPTHIFPPPYFMYARFPTYLKTMESLFGFRWPMTFEIYHYVLYVLGIVIALNGIGILFLPKYKKITNLLSVIGGILFSLIMMFFFFIFTKVNFPTAVIFGLYSAILLFMELLIFRASANQRVA